MQKGGFNIKPLKESDFKYTIDPNRKLWTKNVFPMADYLIEAILNIPWHTYRFEGDCKFWYGREIDTRKKYVTDESDQFEFVQMEAKITATTHDVPYFFFGGCVYEILDRLYGKEPGVPNLRAFVDPTGDLDVNLELPKIKKFEPLNRGSNQPTVIDYVVAYIFEERPPETTNDPNTDTLETYQNRQGRPRVTTNCPTENTVKTSKDTRTYNTLIENYTTWIMEQFALNLTNYKRGGTLWNSLFGNTVPFSIDEDAEGMFADKIICIDNLKIVRCFLPYMDKIKIQLIAKFQGMDHSDHICEFLLPILNKLERQQFIKYGHKAESYQIQKKIPFSSFLELIDGNQDGASNRLRLLKGVNRHKFYNHIMRMAYLNQFFEAKVNKLNERNPSKLNLGRYTYGTTMMYLHEYCLFIFDQYFHNVFFFALDYNMIDRFPLNANTLQQLSTGSNSSRKRAELLDRLIGNFPKFFMEKKLGTFFFAGGTGYILMPEHPKISEWLQSLPDPIKRKMKIDSMAETMAMRADTFYLLLREMNILRLE